MRLASGVAEYILAVSVTALVWQVLKLDLISTAMPRMLVVLLTPLAVSTLVILRRISRHIQGAGPIRKRFSVAIAEVALLALAVALAAAAVSVVLLGDYPF